jgi:ribosomal protein L7Ae-like RNA K-turn-binding protein
MMSLYFVRHQHSAETCPAKDPQMGAMLLTHINPMNARKFGVNLLGDAVLDGQHTFVVIAESDNQQNVENFMQPFMMAGPVEISPASTCEVVVERLGC